MPKPLSFLQYHRPELHLEDAQIPALTQESNQCIWNLASYRNPKPLIPLLPRSRCAAVLVALFVGRKGDLYVLLSRRSASLRTYAGDTSLPGGKVDPVDGTFEDTARREAYEEIGLPLDPNKVPLLCVLEPFVASNDTVVTPVVVLILDNTMTPILNAAEVTSLFSHPLASFLTTTSPFPSDPEHEEVPYYSYTDWEYTGPNGQVWPGRAHRFLTGREAGGIKPIFGLTSSILIQVAMVGYGRQPEFQAKPSGAPSRNQSLAWMMLRAPAFGEACEKEGVRMDWELVKRIAFEGVDDQDPDSENQLTWRSRLRDGDESRSKM